MGRFRGGALGSFFRGIQQLPRQSDLISVEVRILFVERCKMPQNKHRPPALKRRLIRYRYAALKGRSSTIFGWASFHHSEGQSFIISDENCMEERTLRLRPEVALPRHSAQFLYLIEELW